MQHHQVHRPGVDNQGRISAGLNLQSLLHPANGFSHPSRVMADPDLTLAEKRAILASWASDAWSVESGPGVRHQAGQAQVEPDEILEALRMLDQQAGKIRVPRYRRILADRRPGVFGRRPKDRRAHETPANP